MKNITRPIAYAQIYRAFWGEDHRPWPIWEDFSDKSDLCLIKQHEFIATPEQLITHAYFIVKGLVVAYREFNDQKFVHWIRGEDDYVFIRELGDAPFNRVSKDNKEILLAVEETTAIRIRYEDLVAVGEAHPEFLLRMKSYLLNQLKVFQELDKNVTNPLEDRYRNMQAAVSFSLERVPDEYLASYLSMTVEQLKRIKRKMGI